MKVLLVNTLYTPWQVGGAERSVQLLAEGLVRRGIEAMVVALTPNDIEEHREIGGVSVRYLPLANLYWPHEMAPPHALQKPAWHAIDSFNPRMGAVLARLLADEAPDIVHTNNLSGFSVAVWRRVAERGIPIVHTLRDYYLACPRATMFRNGRNCGRRCFDCLAYSLTRQWASQSVDAVVGISRDILKRHRALGFFSNARALEVIYNPYDAPEPPPPRSDAEASRPVVFGYLGRLSSEKGLEIMLEAFRHLATTEYRWELRIAGSGDATYVASLRSAAPAQATFLGHVDPTAFLTGVDALIVPSRWHEPMGRVVIEAFAHGVPVVGARRGGIPELIDEGITGWSFDPDRGASLTSVLKRLLDDPSKLHDARSACLTAGHRFGVRPCVERYAAVYETVTATGAT